jgi:hypothetical protein
MIITIWKFRRWTQENNKYKREKYTYNENLREERSSCNLKHLLLRNGNYAG